MFVPFAWSVITSFKTLPDSVDDSTLIPRPVSRSTHGSTRGTTLKPALPVMFFNSCLIAGAVTITNLVLGSLGRLCLRAAAVPRPRAAVPGRARDADDPRPAAPRAGVRACSTPWGSLAGQLQYVGVIAGAGDLGDQRVPAAPVLPLDAAASWRRRRASTVPASSRPSGGCMLPLAGAGAGGGGDPDQFQGTWNSFFWPLIFLRNQAVLDPAAGSRPVPAARAASPPTGRRSWPSS